MLNDSVSQALIACYFFRCCSFDEFCLSLAVITGYTRMRYRALGKNKLSLVER